MKSPALTLRALSRYPIVSLAPGFMSRTSLDSAFRKAGLTPRITFNAADTDVIKAWVTQGHGIAVVARIAYNRRTDRALKAIDASHLFEPYAVQVGLPPRTRLRPFAYDFIELLAPHLTRNVVMRQHAVALS